MVSVIYILASTIKITEIIRLINDNPASVRANAAPAQKNPPAGLCLTSRKVSNIISQGYKERIAIITLV